MTVLLVCDSELIGNHLTDALSSSKKVEKISQVLSGDDALRLIEIETPEVVIVDILSERGKGLNALRRIKQLRRSLPLIAISMSGSQQYFRHSMKAGADCFYRLPEDISRLIELFND